jgi:hypothetical protein
LGWSGWEGDRSEDAGRIENGNEQGAHEDGIKGKELWTNGVKEFAKNLPS